MRVVGRALPSITAKPGAQALWHAALHQQTGAALTRLNCTGIAKGIYRFSSHEEADRQRQDAQVRVIVANVTRALAGR